MSRQPPGKRADYRWFHAITTRWIDNDSVKYSVFDALDKEGAFNANGTGIMIWGKYLQQQMVQSTSTMHLRTFASYTPGTKKLVVFFLNKSDDAITVNPEIDRHNVKEITQTGELTSTGPDDVSPVWTEQRWQIPLVNLTVKANSIKVVIYQL